MFRLIVHSILPLLLLWSMPIWVYAQNGPSRHDLQAQIDLTDRLLSETENRREIAFSELGLIRKKVELREKLLFQLEKEIISIEQQIDDLSGLIGAMETDISRIQENYGKTARQTYQSFDTDNFWLSIFSSESLSEAYYRALYFRKFSQYRREQVQLIQRTKQFLEEQSESLSVSIAEKETLLLDKQEELNLLQADKAEQDVMFTQIRQQEISYQKQIERQREQLFDLIQTTSRTAPVVKDEFSKKETTLAAEFADNQGRIPWPVVKSEGIVVGKFGKYRDPYGNAVHNDGIFIRTATGQAVRSVFAGRVSAVRLVPMSGTAVIIQHGDFYSVYANLAATPLEVGQVVHTNQRIGTVRTDKRTGETTLNFMIYQKPSTFLDPEEWLAGKQ
ncbi:MAG: peptidoglycan DD-metalloendopeptidase family protein [Bacteroidota bacterium]